jgi:hypothetical protein
LLCYQAKVASKLTNPTAAGLIGLQPGDPFPSSTKQAKHQKHSKADGTQVYTTPGNGLPAPDEVDTSKQDLVCIPTSVVGVIEPE